MYNPFLNIENMLENSTQCHNILTGFVDIIIISVDDIINKCMNTYETLSLTFIYLKYYLYYSKTFFLF